MSRENIAHYSHTLVASVGHKTLCCIHAIRGVAYSLVFFIFYSFYAQTIST